MNDKKSSPKPSLPFDKTEEERAAQARATEKKDDARPAGLPARFKLQLY